MFWHAITHMHTLHNCVKGIVRGVLPAVGADTWNRPLQYEHLH